MKCPHCHIEGRVDAAGIRIENDDTPDKPTKVYAVQTVTCINPQCREHGKVFETLETALN